MISRGKLSRRWSSGIRGAIMMRFPIVTLAAVSLAAAVAPPLGAQQV